MANEVDIDELLECYSSAVICRPIVKRLGASFAKMATALSEASVNHTKENPFGEAALWIASAQYRGAHRTLDALASIPLPHEPKYFASRLERFKRGLMMRAQSRQVNRGEYMDDLDQLVGEEVNDQLFSRHYQVRVAVSELLEHLHNDFPDDIEQVRTFPSFYLEQLQGAYRAVKHAPHERIKEVVALAETSRK